IEILDGPSNTTRVQATTPTFETFDFAADAFTALEVYGMGGSDVITLTSLDPAEDTLATVRLDGDVNAGTADLSDDVLRVASTSNLPATSVVSLFGGAGSDTFVLDGTPADGSATGTVNAIATQVQVSPSGDEGGAADVLTIVDTDDPDGDTVTI